MAARSKALVCGCSPAEIVGSNPTGGMDVAKKKGGVRFGDRILVRARFSAGAHPASHTVGTGSLFPGAKRPGCGVDHPPPFSAEVHQRVESFLCSSSGPSWSVLG